MIKRTAFILSLILGLACASRGQVMMLFTQDSLMNISSPLSIDSLFYWFAADQGVTDSLGGAIANNEGVGTWEDLSANGYDVTGAGGNTKRPVYKATGGPGSKPCIQFDGSNDYLASTAHFWESDDLSVIIVFKNQNATNNAFEMVLTRHEVTTNGQFQLYYNPDASGTDQDYIFVFSAFQSGSTSTNLQTYLARTGSGGSPTLQKSTNWTVCSFTSNGSGTAGLFSDGNSKTTDTSSSGTGNGTIYNSSTPGLGIGARNVGGTPELFLKGSISEIIVYTKALTAAERGAIETYLNKKYDLY